MFLDGGNIPVPIFLSYAKPFNKKQEEFIEKVILHFEQNDFDPKTLGEDDYGHGFHGIATPMENIRDKMKECFGLLSIAFRRTYIEKGTGKLNADIEGQEVYDISKKWITSPYCHIEPSMAFQINMPILIFREKGVIADGILEKGVVPYYMPEFDLDKPIDEYFKSSHWIHLFEAWKALVLKYKTEKLFGEDDIIKHIISYSICKGKNITIDELFNMFKNTIDFSDIDFSKHYDGTYHNDYETFLNQLKSRLGVKGEDLETEYKIKKSLYSDYITICTNFFN